MLYTKYFLKPDEITIDNNKDFVAEIPLGIKNRQELFKVLKNVINLPEYFGYNWDALLECAEDFSWIEQSRVVIIHKDIPLINEKEALEYQDILATAVQYWQKKNLNRLIVIFP